MTTSSTKIIYALLIGFGLFILCGAALLWVDNRRIERHTDELNDLRLHLNGRDHDVAQLRRQLRDCCADSNLLSKPKVKITEPKATISDGWDH
ncbi:hypothetical protein [Fibrella forsythiae]|uniref:Uncharacterized protein n=1 Tax=Fibrella forsythiae TaxID=2817061 RepID=A0ABS3JN78_9BACT|nr:hypothetical protein [Fibrella forsythiae]MBO0951456.1 hypothetical protein [Fibrella forsythiae]